MPYNILDLFIYKLLVVAKIAKITHRTTAKTIIDIIATIRNEGFFFGLATTKAPK